MIMKLIIDIPKDMYKDANILIVKDLPELKKIIANGTPYVFLENEKDPIQCDNCRKYRCHGCQFFIKEKLK